MTSTQNRSLAVLMQVLDPTGELQLREHKHVLCLDVDEGDNLDCSLVLRILVGRDIGRHLAPLDPLQFESE